MDIEQCDYEIGVGRIDLLVIEMSPVYIAQRVMGSRVSQYEESL